MAAGVMELREDDGLGDGVRQVGEVGSNGVLAEDADDGKLTAGRELETIAATRGAFGLVLVNAFQTRVAAVFSMNVAGKGGRLRDLAAMMRAMGGGFDEVRGAGVAMGRDGAS